MKKDDYVKIVGVDGNYRFGYIEQIKERGLILTISLFEEGRSKIAYDEATAAFIGYEPTDYLSLLTEAEKRLIPFLAANYATKAIAAELSLSPKTVRAQLRILRIKLQLDNKPQLCAFAGGLEAIMRKQDC